MQKLIDRGHRVVIITHAYGSPYPNRTGIRYLTNRLKVYHIPHWVVYRSTTFPTVFSSFPILRQIFIREQIQIVHGHASLSNLCHEGLLHARTMGLHTVFTDHSLFGFSDAGSIMANKLLKFSLSDVGHVVCVSHTWYAIIRASQSDRTNNPQQREHDSARITQSTRSLGNPQRRRTQQLPAAPTSRSKGIPPPRRQKWSATSTSRSESAYRTR